MAKKKTAKQIREEQKAAKMQKYRLLSKQRKQKKRLKKRLLLLKFLSRKTERNHLQRLQAQKRF